MTNKNDALKEAELVTREGEVKPRLQPDMNGVVSFGSDSQDPSRSPYNMSEVAKGEDMDRGKFELLPENYSDLENVTKVRTHEGYVIARHDPYGFWKVVGHTAKGSTRPIPEVLRCSFTDLGVAVRAINKYKGLTPHG